MSYDKSIEVLQHHARYGGYHISDENNIMIQNDLKRAKKVEELLGLYREYYGHIPYSDNPRIKYCELKIDTMEDKLEEELK